MRSASEGSAKIRTPPRGAVLAALVLVLLAAACTKPAPPIAGPGEALTGLNPDVPTTPGARTSVIRYGPWTVPGATGPGHEGAGMLENHVGFAVQRPCGNCFITGFTPRLVYPDGTVANIDTGAWLHHFALYAAAGRNDPSCVAPFPYNLLGERIFAGGNERTRARFPAGTGVRVGALDTWILVYDLMNTAATPKPLAIELTYDWVPASTPNMHAARAVYLDVSPVCLESRMPAGTGAFTHERTYPAPLSGRVVGVAGHMHDGAVRVTLSNATTGQLICDSQAGYGGPGYEAPADHAGGHDGADPAEPVRYLSSVGQCISPSVDRPFAVLRPGDQLHVQMFYDLGVHPAHAHAPDGVMGHFFGYILEE